MTIVILKNFWRKVVRCATDSLFAFAFEVYLSSETKVSNLKLHSLSKEEISQLQVPVNDFILVYILHALN